LEFLTLWKNACEALLSIDVSAPRLQKFGLIDIFNNPNRQKFRLIGQNVN